MNYSINSKEKIKQEFIKDIQDMVLTFEDSFDPKMELLYQTEQLFKKYVEDRLKDEYGRGYDDGWWENSYQYE
jgi:hypothetical protein